MYIEKQKKNKPFIFTKKINTDYKLIPFKENGDIGRTKYSPASSKEWKNSIYTFNKNNMKNLPLYDTYINNLIKNYFNLYFDHEFIKQRQILRKSKRKSFNKIYVSRAEIKHTNSKGIITIYVYNQEEIKLWEKIDNLRLSLFNDLLNLLIINENITDKNNLLSLIAENKIDFLNLKYIPKKLYKQLLLIRRYKLKLDLNKSKFEDKFLYRLSRLISKYYNKQMEFNIIKLKSIAHNSDIFTEVLTLKLRKPSNPLIDMNSLLGKVRLPVIVNKIIKGKIQNSKNIELLDNKYPKLNISSIINNSYFENDNLNKLILNAYDNASNTTLENIESDVRLNDNDSNDDSYDKLRNVIFNSIKYKNINGIRLAVKGRLTRRFRADRAVFKLKWKGGLRDVDSSYKGLSTTMFRGSLGSNLEYSKFTSKRRIGSFAVKGWFNGR